MQRARATHAHADREHCTCGPVRYRRGSDELREVNKTGIANAGPRLRGPRTCSQSRDYREVTHKCHAAATIASAAAQVLSDARTSSTS